MLLFNVVEQGVLCDPSRCTRSSRNHAELSTLVHNILYYVLRIETRIYICRWGASRWLFQGPPISCTRSLYTCLMPLASLFRRRIFHDGPVLRRRRRRRSRTRRRSLCGRRERCGESSGGREDGVKNGLGEFHVALILVGYVGYWFCLG